MCGRRGRGSGRDAGGRKYISELGGATSGLRERRTVLHIQRTLAFCNLAEPVRYIENIQMRLRIEGRNLSPPLPLPHAKRAMSLSSWRGERSPLPEYCRRLPEGLIYRSGTRRHGAVIFEKIGLNLICHYRAYKGVSLRFTVAVLEKSGRNLQ